MALDYEGVTELDSPTGTDPSPAVDPTSSAGTQNTEPSGQPIQGRENWMPQGRAEEMAQRRVERALEQQRQEFSREREQLLQSFDQRSQAQQQSIMQALQQRASQPSRTAEQETERRQALELLNDLVPGLRHMPALAQSHLDQRKQFEAFSQQFAQEIAQLKQARAQDFTSGEQGRLQQLAGQAGLSFANGQQFSQFEDYVAGVIRSNPEAHAAFVAGNREVLPWAFGIARQQMAAPLQAERARLAETKTNTGRLPPTNRGGGVPGAAPSLPKFNPDNPGAFQRDLSAKAREFLLERTGQS